MKDGRATRYSVQGYGDRMTASIGLNHLGEDRNPGQGPHPLNLVLEEVSEDEAFVTTLQVAKGVLAKYFPPLPGGIEGEPKEIPIDLLNFSDLVLSGLCKQWIGLPDDKTYMVTGGRLEDNTGITRCPGNLMAVSRYIFTPHPTDEVIKAGQKQGKAVLDAVKNWLASPGPQLGSIALKIQQKTGANLTDEKFANNLAGVLLGFPPTVQGNFIRTMENWIEEKGLWQHQQSLFEHAPGVELTYKQASLALSEALFATMRKRPVPGMLWRSPVTKSGVDKEPSHRVVLGIASALTDETAPVELMFGRDAEEAKVPTAHGCPGYKMAMGILLAMIATLLRAGTLRPTGSPVLLILVPFLPEPAVQSMP
jgi:cytochrome P450